MTLPIIICDDSSFARKQMARALPQGWNVEVTFAENGQQAVDAVRDGKGDILFLDLTMPVLDGYGALEIIRRDDLPTMVIVVSGDVQQDAHERVMSLGALDFIKKPIDTDKLTEVLDKYGVLDELTASTVLIDAGQVEMSDWISEIANVAMGITADLLAQLFHVFVHLSIPRVSLLDSSDLRMVLGDLGREQQEHPVICQGFSAGRISGENILRISHATVSDIAELMDYQGEISDKIELELVMDISNILIGAFLKGLAGQLDLTFSQGQPSILDAQELRAVNLPKEQKALSIELTYTFDDCELVCDQLILFTEDSLETLETMASYAVG